MDRRRFVVTLLFVILANLAASTDDVEYNSTKANGTGSRWISQLFSKGRSDFDMDANVNARCKEDFELYKTHLENQSIWAVRMLESSEWPSVGIFSGMTYNLGNWKECLTVSKYNVRGQYCLVNAMYNISHHRKTGANRLKWPDEGASAWDAFEEFQTKPWIVNRQSLYWSMCVPASCGYEDLEISLNRTLQPVFREQGFSVAVDVNPRLCSTSKKESYPFGFHAICALLATIVMLLVMSTTYDVVKRLRGNSKPGGKKSASQQLCEAFSLAKNYEELIHVSCTDSPMMYFMKIFHMCFLILGHRSMYFLTYPKFTTEHIENTLYRDEGFTYSNFFVVDIFFMISGFITFYFGISKIRERGYTLVVQNIIQRWARMTFVYTFLILIIINIIPYASEGPVWTYRIQQQADNCRASFWPNFFAVSNIIALDKMCLFTGWYVSTDLQLAVIGYILLTVYAKNKKLGIFCTWSTFIAGMVITFIVSYVNNYHAVLPVYMSYVERFWEFKEFTGFYVQTYTRLGPYLVGFGAAVVTRKLQEKKVTFQSKHYVMGIAFDLFIKSFTLTYVERFLDFMTEYKRVENSLNAAFFCSLYVLPNAIYLCLYFTSGLISSLKYFDLKIYVPIGRLIYCVFLVHPVIQIYNTASYQMVMPTFSLTPMFWMYTADVVYSYLIAFILYLTIEAPTNSIIRLITSLVFRRKDTKTCKDTQATNNKNVATQHEESIANSA